MRDTSLAFIGIILACAPLLAQTSQPTATTTAASIDALLGDLGSDVFRTRQEAQKKIVAMGNAATQPVNELLKTTKDPEVQQRATEILSQIAAADRSSGSRVTLKFKKAPAMEVYKSLYEQAHAKLRVDKHMLPAMRQGQDDPLVSIDVTDVPFWQAMRTLNKQTEWGMDAMGGSGNLGMDPFKRMRGPASINGPYMVVASDDFGPGSFNRLTVYVEPRLELVSHDSHAEIIEMLDDNGDPIQQRDPGMPKRTETARGNAFELHQPFITPGREKIAYLKGTIGASLLAQKNKVEIENIMSAQNLEKAVDGRRFVVHMMNPEPGSYFLVAIAYNTDPPTPGFDKIKFDLVDREDRSYSTGGSGSTGGGGKRFVCNIEFKQPNGVGTPSKLIMEFPSVTEQVKIPFEFGKRPDGAAPAKPEQDEDQ